ncbi:hypothetical protein [Succinivibrio dextrinosolvens]|uniref:hypothetical protein n=1 Tax=Succinivibrio dextrinosolvens TaxID=83771 RepID=UPI0019242540|nr:hypothetical protein [Succinivibrio dextrinosolvens]
MGFSLFTRDKSSDSSEAKAKASLFTKIRSNIKTNRGTGRQNKSVSHNFRNNEPSFGTSSFSAYQNNTPVNSPDGSINNLNNSLNNGQFNPDNPLTGFMNGANNQGLDSVNGSSYNQADSKQNKVDNYDDISNNYYKYKSDESYLNEEGRNKDHLYIAPGEPLVKKKKTPEEIKAEENAKLFDNKATGDDNRDLNKAPLFATQNTIIRTSDDKDENEVLSALENTDKSAETEEDSPYIAPGAPLNRKANKRSAADSITDSALNSQDTVLSRKDTKKAQVNDDSDSIYITPGAKPKVFDKKEDDGPIYITPGAEGDRLNAQRKKQQELAQENKATLNESAAQKIAESNLQEKLNSIDDLPRFKETADYEQKNIQKTLNKSIFANVKDTSVNTETANGFAFNKAEEAAMLNGSDNRNISGGVYFFLFVRQLFASFFNYTNLGVVFARSALQWIGPSKPGFMPIPYFGIGFICSLFALILEDYTNPLLCAQLVLVVYLLLVGCDGFRGLGKLLSEFSQRKSDTYVKAVIVIITAAIFTACFEYYISVLKPDLSFCFGFGVVVMLSALCATSINYGENDDPVSSYGSLGLTGLLMSLVFCVAVTFMIVEWQIALSMIGICAFTRLVLGQYIYAKGINASIEVVCSVQLITMILLMLDLLFATQSFNFIAESFLRLL